MLPVVRSNSIDVEVEFICDVDGRDLQRPEIIHVPTLQAAIGLVQSRFKCSLLPGVRITRQQFVDCVEKAFVDGYVEMSGDLTNEHITRARGNDTSKFCRRIDQ